MAAATLTVAAAFTTPVAAAQQDDGAVPTVVARQLTGPDGLAMTYPLAMNKHGAIVGSGVGADNRYRSVLWDDGQLMTLPPARPGESTSILTINDKGQAAGEETTGSTTRIVVWDDHVPRELDIAEHPIGVAGINDHGQILVDTPEGPMLYTRGDVQEVKVPPPLVPGHFGYAVPLNNRGQALVAADTWDDLLQNLVWSDGTTTPVNPPGDVVEATLVGINDQGQVLGAGWSPSAQEYRPFVWRNGTATTLQGLGSQSSNFVSAHAQNQSGDVVGDSTVDGGHVAHEVLWTGGQPVDLGTLGGHSSAYAVNENQEVAGVSATADGTKHATLWRDGHLYDLGVPPGYVSSGATGITANGKVVGYALRADWHTAAFEWTVR